MIVLRQVGIKCINNTACEHLLGLGEVFRHWSDVLANLRERASGPMFFVHGPDSFFLQSRFKPVYRVQAPSRGGDDCCRLLRGDRLCPGCPRRKVPA